MLVKSKELASLWLVALLFGVGSASHHCYIAVKNNEGPRVRVDSECEEGKITWINPSEERVIRFTDKNKSFKMCFGSARAGASVYRVEGYAKTLLSSNSEPGPIGCLDSDCKHVTLLLQPTSSNTLEYNYTTSITNACPKCTSDCQRNCFCNSKYVFIAQVSKSIVHVRNHRWYQNYVKIRYFLRHNGNFTGQLGTVPPSCPAVNTTADHKQIIMNHVPKYGTLKVRSKCSLEVGKTYLFSASLHHTGHGAHNPRLTVCCAQEDYKHAWTFYSYLLKNRRCC